MFDRRAPSTTGRRADDDTIVAIATGAGESAVGVVRVSGREAMTVSAPLVRAAEPITRFTPRVVRRVALVHPETGARLDDALCVVMQAPRSYTGDDVVELSCHGSPALLTMIVGCLVASGARLAAPGEFTRRAFLNGRLDLAQAEAVALLIGARTERAVARAARTLAGGLSVPVRRAREALVDLMASLEVLLDFPDEGFGADLEGARKTAAGLADDIRRCLESARAGRVVQEGVTIAIVGPPNVGKSSLFNALVGRDRAIVSPAPGTTRDVIEATIVMAGVPVRLLDTAGLGDARDLLEAEGMRRARGAIQEADVLIVVLDSGSLRSRLPSPPIPRGGAASPDTPHRGAARQYFHSLGVEGRDGAADAGGEDRGRIVVRSKSDLRRGHGPEAGIVSVSTVTGQGLDELSERLRRAIEGLVAGDGEESGIVASLRQSELLGTAYAALCVGGDALGAAPLEVALLDLETALGAISNLLGVEVGDAVLDRVFATFCVGK